MLIFPELSTGHFPHYKISTPLAMPFRVMLCRKKLSGLEEDMNRTLLTTLFVTLVTLSCTRVRWTRPRRFFRIFRHGYACRLGALLRSQRTFVFP